MSGLAKIASHDMSDKNIGITLSGNGNSFLTLKAFMCFDQFVDDEKSPNICRFPEEAHMLD